jgi:hypothetical protein
VRIPPGLARNQRVKVRITDVTGSLSGVVEPSRT